MAPRLRDARPTRRGWAVVLVAALAMLAGATAGSRSLNAVVVPAIVALAAGAGQVALADPPTVEREPPRPGFQVEHRTVEGAVRSDLPCRVTDTLPRGLAADGDPTADVGHGGHFRYTIGLRERGGHDVGPARCQLTDSLGLFALDVEAGAATTAIVYPEVFELDGSELSALVRRASGDEQVSFTRLREFELGDTRRDIHWRASAKRQPDEFLVAEYDSHADVEAVTVVGEAAPGSADAMADTVASIGAFLHDAGIPVTVVVPGGRCLAHPGEAATMLRVLALTGDGFHDGPEAEGADVRVVAKGRSATVSLPEHDLEFAGLAGERRGREVVA